MFDWYSGFCTGIAGFILLALLVCICSAVWHSGTISQIEEKQKPQ